MDEQTTSTSGNSSPFFVTGGTLALDAPSYVERDADRLLLDALSSRQFAAVLDTRQIGKSSLMVRAANALKDQGTRVALLDLTRLGQPATPEQWYYGLLLDLGQQIGLRSELRAYWQENKEIGPLPRWVDALRAVALPASDTPLVVFIDEIDAVLNLPFSADAFFAALRECYTRRAADPAFQNLTFCLLGSATPDTLMRDVRTTPFNIGVRVEPTDFTEAEALAFAPALSAGGRDGKKLLQRVLYWTGGHPYLTQRLCQAVAEDASVTNAGGVDRVCDALFLSASARERESNLTFVGSRLLRGTEDRAGVLDLYGRVRARGLGLVSGIKDDSTDPLCQALRLAGVVRVVEGYLWVRNRIYFRVFDAEWVRANLPDAEVKRQRAAFRRGVLRSLAGFGVIAALLAALAWTALRERNAADASASAAKTAKLASDRNATRADQNAARADVNAHEAEANAQTAREQTQLAQRREQERSAALAQALHEKNLATQNARLAQLAEQDAKVKAEEATQSATLARSEKTQAQQNAKTAEDRADYAREVAYDADMTLVQKTYALGGIKQAITILNSYVPKFGQHDYRGVEWRYLTKLCHSETRSRTFAENGNPVAISPSSGDFLLEYGNASLSPREYRWQIVTPKGMILLSTSSMNAPMCLGYSRSGKSVLFEDFVDSSRRAYAACNAATGQMLYYRLVPTSFQANETMFQQQSARSMDGERIIFTDRDGRNHIWNIATGTTLCDLEMPKPNLGISNPAWGSVFTFSTKDDVVYATLSGTPKTELLKNVNGGSLVAQGDKGVSAIGEWDATTGSFKSLTIIPEGLVREILLSHDDRFMIVTTRNGITIYQKLPGRGWTNQWNLIGPYRYPGAVSHDNTKIAIYDTPQSQIGIYDLATGALLAIRQGIPPSVKVFEFSPDSQQVSGCVDASLRTWRIDPAMPAGAVQITHDQSFLSSAISPDTRYYFSVEAADQGSRYPKGFIFDRAKGKTTEILLPDGFDDEGPSSEMFPPHVAAFSGNGKVIAVGFKNGRICTIDVDQGKIRQTMKASSSSVSSVALSQDGRRVAAAHHNGLVEVWDVIHGNRLYTALRRTNDMSDVDNNFAFTLSSDGTKLAYDEARRLIVCEVTNAKTLAIYDKKKWVDGNPNSPVSRSCKFIDHDNLLFFMYGKDAHFISFRNATNRAERIFSVPYYPLNPFDFFDASVTQDGGRIIFNDAYGLHIWDVATKRETVAIPAYNGHRPYLPTIDATGFTSASWDDDLLCNLPNPIDTQQVQSAVADTQTTFETIPSATTQSAIDARDAKDALTRLDQTGTFVGTVRQVVTTPDHTWTTLVFADDKAALTARLYAGSYTVFPRLDQLKGKRVLVTGRFDLDKGKVHVELVEPTQIQIVAGK